MRCIILWRENRCKTPVWAAQVRAIVLLLTTLGDLVVGMCGNRTDRRLFAGSRYIYDLYYEKEAISKQLYDWLLKNGYADANLIAKWKKQGYEKVCLRPVRSPTHG